MDILSWGARQHSSWLGRCFIHPLYLFIRLLTPKGILINAFACNAAISELYRKTTLEIMVVLGGFQDPRPHVRRLGFGPLFLLGGNKSEQENFRTALNDCRVMVLPYSKSILEEAQQALIYTRQKKESRLGIMVHELLCPRATCTFIQQVRKGHDNVSIIPYPCLDSHREEMMPAYRNLAVLIEAWKLWWYQRKGDVAILPDLIQYVRKQQDFLD